MNSAVSALLWVFKNFDFEAPNQLLPHQRGFFKELWRLHQINFSCVQNGRPILEYFIEMERLGFEYRTQQQGANVVFEMIGRDTAWLHSKTVFKAQQILKLSPCVCYPNGYESQREQIHPIVQVTAEELFEIDGQRGVLPRGGEVHLLLPPPVVAAVLGPGVGPVVQHAQVAAVEGVEPAPGWM